VRGNLHMIVHINDWETHVGSLKLCVQGFSIFAHMGMLYRNTKWN
jgi:hypothetical protein